MGVFNTDRAMPTTEKPGSTSPPASPTCFNPAKQQISCNHIKKARISPSENAGIFFAGPSGFLMDIADPPSHTGIARPVIFINR
jgi:hypothetical protein